MFFIFCLVIISLYKSYDISIQTIVTILSLLFAILCFYYWEYRITQTYLEKLRIANENSLENEIASLKEEIKTYAISIAAALAVGGVSALLTAGNMDIYSEIVNPPLAPPSVLFPIVWTLLYILMGISAAMIYLKKEENPTAVRNSLITYGISLFLNFFWSIIFFNMQSYLFAFIWILLLWISILLTVLQYRKISPLAAALQVPYLLWVTFAAYLNLAIFLLNM